jgi:diguanylate cyclase (GGDEF)-like protein/PAS domain S-box-containing protein
MSPTSLAMLMVLVAAAEAAACLFLIRREQIKRRVAERTSAESCARMVELQELARIGTWEFDLLHDQIRWSAETFRIFGLPAGSQELDFADLLLAIDPEDRSEFDRAIQMAITEGQAYKLDLRIYTPEGTQKFIHAQGSAVYDDPGKATRLIGTILDITERKREENQLATAATHDPLTGLSNRRHGSAELEQSIRDARETATPLAVCLCDIDRFKQINDTHGHSAGDGVLHAVAQCLAAGIRRGDLAIRWGGDEFCLLFPGASAANAAVSVERIRQSLESLTFSASDGSEYGVTGTFGVAGLVSGMSSEALLEAADRALYCAKQQGRNRIGDVSVIGPFVASSKKSPQTQLRSPSAPVPKADEPSATPP